MQPIPRSSGLLIEHISHTWINPAWMRNNFFAPHWRLYHNETPGARLLLGDHRWELTPDVVVAIPPGTACASDVDPDARISHWYIHFRGGQLYDSARPTVHLWPYDAMAKLGWERIRAGVHNRQLDTPEARMAATMLVSQALCRIPAKDLDYRPMDPRIQAAIRRVYADLSRPIHVAELARESGLSRVSFTRLFRAVTGETPHGYILQVKLDHTRNLLETGDLSLELIAERAGFSDRFHFTRHFSRRFGMGPAAHRRNYRRMRPS